MSAEITCAEIWCSITGCNFKLEGLGAQRQDASESRHLRIPAFLIACHRDVSTDEEAVAGTERTAIEEIATAGIVMRHHRAGGTVVVAREVPGETDKTMVCFYIILWCMAC